MKKISIFLALFTLIIDQITKHLAVTNFVEYISVTKVTEFFNLVLVYNRGISFGLFNQSNYSNYIFLCLSIIIICFLLKWLIDSVMLAESLALGITIGGAIGNVVDRIFRPGVVDFIQLHWNEYYWPNFNIADSAICLGVAILIVSSIDIKRD
ncbi:MAG: signal peptidase II [Rickettsiales bacterium]|jgi:signal peptidase II|nr:signal peptidase II [Rickettsiales bacterium]